MTPPGPGPTPSAARPPRIGFVTLWFERGQAHVTRGLRRALLSAGADVHLFARTAVLGDVEHMATGPGWDPPNLTRWPEFTIPPAVLCDWINTHQLDAVVFNEEHDWSLVAAARATGTAVLTWLDFYRHDWAPRMALYDGVLCGSRRARGFVSDHPGAAHVGWAVDTELFAPPEAEPPHTFFHNAGWLGLNFRKMTPACILAFDAIAPFVPDATLLVHAQAPREALPPVVQRLIDYNERITYRVETVPAPGLYHQGRVLLFPSKLEGLGLPLFEGLACGMPVIAADAPPMNEYVRHDDTGLLVPVRARVARADGIAMPEELIDVNALAQAMATLARSPERVAEMGRSARGFACAELRMDALGVRARDVVDQAIARRRSLL